MVFRKRFNPNWVFKTYFKMIGGFPIDYSAQVMYLLPDGKSTVRLSFQLSDKDFIYVHGDYTRSCEVQPVHAPQSRTPLTLQPIHDRGAP